MPSSTDHRPILVAALALACTPPNDPITDADDELGEDTGDTDETGDEALVTYHRDVRPILAQHCVGCHRAGGIAPFALDSAEATIPFAELIATVTAARTMPPYGADNSGECHTFRDARWLSDVELASLAAWAEAGAPEGDPATAPADPPPPAGLDGEIRTLTMAAPYTPSPELDDDYRCFLIDGAAPAGTDTFVTGFDVHPGNPEILHHVIVWAPRNADAVAQAIALDEAEQGQGYTCFGTAGVAASVVAAWAPGGVPSRYPEGIGIPLLPDAPLIVQMHYNTLAGPDMQDQSSIDLRVVDGGVTPARFTAIADLALALAPGESQVSTSHEATLPGMNAGVPLRVHGVFPHMHTLGRELELTAADEACLIRVPRYDFHWQLLYFYDEPIDLPADQLLSITCGYDTTSRSETTYWGEGTMDEMCIAGLLVTDT
jgi:mono/diheme cytochrome c family protein